MKRFILFALSLLFFHPTNAWAFLTCDTADFYFKNLLKHHVTLNKKTLQKLSYAGAKKSLDELKLPKTQKIELLKAIKAKGDDFKGICEILLKTAIKKDPTAHLNISPPIIQSYLTHTIDDIDPHTRFLETKAVNKTLKRLSQKFDGLGIILQPPKGTKKGPFKIARLVPASQSRKRGLQVDDMVTHLNGRDCKKMTITELSKLIHETKGPYTLKVNRGGTPITIKGVLKSGLFWPSVIPYFINQNGLVYIRITSFGTNTSEELVETLSNLKKAYGDDLKGILLDLRDNLGGAVTAAIGVIDAFIDDGPAMYQFNPKTKKGIVTIADNGGEETEAPLLILINNRSASASELVSGALQDYGRAVILGNRSFGKGTVLNLLMSPSDQIQIKTTSDTSGISLVYYASNFFYRPSGQTVQGQGVTPDIWLRDPDRIKMISESRRRKDEKIFFNSDYKNHLRATPLVTHFKPEYEFRDEARGKIGHIRWSRKYSIMEKADIQLSKAIDYLKRLTGSKITENHFGIPYLYKIPYPRLHINTDLHEKGSKLVVRFRFSKREKSFPLFGSWKSKVIFQDFLFVTGNQLTLNLNKTPVAEYINKHKTGSLWLNIRLQKLTKKHPKGKMYSLDSIVTF